MDVIKTISEPALYLLSWVVAGIMLLFSVFLILATMILTVTIFNELAKEVSHGTLTKIFDKEAKEKLKGIIDEH